MSAVAGRVAALHRYPVTVKGNEIFIETA